MEDKMDVTTKQSAFRADLLSGKTAIVTGASRGIGAAIAHKLCEAGANVVLCSRSAESVAQIADTLRGQGYTAFSMAADISKKEDVDTLIEKTIEQFSQIDILVNNAGITRDMLLMRLKDEDWNAVLQTNLTGTMYCTRAVLRPLIRQRSGRIINISSVVGLVGNPGQAELCRSESRHHRFHKGYRERGRCPRHHCERYRSRFHHNRHDSRNTGRKSETIA